MQVTVRVGLGQLDAEHAADAGDVAHVDPAAVRLDRLARDRQAQAESGAVVAPLDRGENRSSILPGGRPPHASATSIVTEPARCATLIVTVEPARLNFSAFCTRLKTAERSRRGSAEIDGAARRRDDEVDAARLRVRAGVQLDVAQQIGERERLHRGIDAELQRRVRQRVVDHVGGTAQASVEQLDGAVAGGELVAAQPLHRRARRRQRVAQLVGDEAQVLGRLPFQFLIAALDVLGERVRDPGVEPLRAITCCSCRLI